MYRSFGKAQFTGYAFGRLLLWRRFEEDSGDALFHGSPRCAYGYTFGFDECSESGYFKGDIAETRQVLQHLGVRGDVTQCRDMEVYCDSMPDVCGMGARDALYILEREGLNVNIQGRGKVVEQSIPSGKVIQPGTTVILKLK